MIRLKRAYDAPSEPDGTRFLVDRLWPRGIKREDLKIEDWLRDIAPSNDLRKWFGHDPNRWQEFKKRYLAELDEKADALAPLRQAAREGDVTLVFAAKNRAQQCRGTEGVPGIGSQCLVSSSWPWQQPGPDG